MDYKKVINEQIEGLQERQKNVTKNFTSRNDIACLIASTIGRLVEIGSDLKEPFSKKTLLKGNKESDKDGKEQNTTPEK